MMARSWSRDDDAEMENLARDTATKEGHFPQAKANIALKSEAGNI